MAVVTVVDQRAYTGGSITSLSEAVFTFDATVSESPTHESELTDHPIEKGADVTDHVQVKPATLDLSVIVTNAPFPEQGTPEHGRAEAAYDRLLEIWRAGEPVTWSTPRRTWPNMIITRISAPRDSPSGHTVFELALREVVFVDQVFSPVPPAVLKARKAKRGATKKDAGRQGAENAGSADEAAVGEATPPANKAEEDGGSVLNSLFG